MEVQDYRHPEYPQSAAAREPLKPAPGYEDFVKPYNDKVIHPPEG